ncbi:MAG: OsmC family protein [Candidatus Zixiibacteriota bacterium]|nr:MAG: OsmC family protein [candidate division Zixibacteria bacterium]
MRVNVSWKGKLAFQGETESGHRLVFDVKPESGGENRGPTPMETLLAALAGCTGMDVAHILAKKRINLKRFGITVDAERAAEHPKYFTKVALTYDFEGKGIREADVKQAIELSVNKYCSVSAMLQDRVEISYRWKIANLE